MNRKILIPTMVILAATSALAVTIPEPPDLAPLASLVERPTGGCNAADPFQQAEELYRQTELAKPREERQTLPWEHPAMELVLQGMSCRSCEFEFSSEMTLPPTEQLIPMAALYWAAAGSFVQRGEDLLEKDQLQEARVQFARAVSLGLMLYEEPGITFIQDIVALRAMSRGAEGLGDLAIAQGDERTAAVCAVFLARTRAYLDGTTRFIREDLPYGKLLEEPEGQAEQIRKVAGLYYSTRNVPARVEILMLMSLARPLLDDPETRTAIDGVLQRAARDPDRRIRKLAGWGEKMKPKKARQYLAEMACAPIP